MRFAANEQKLDAERVGADEKDRDQEKTKGENGFRIISAEDQLDDRMREDKDYRKTDDGNINDDELDPVHEIKRPGLALVVDLAQSREKRLAERSEREGLAKASQSFSDGIKSRRGVIGEKSDGEDAGCGVGVDRND